MKILIAADMEGITGVVHADQTDSTHAEYQRFRRLMTADVNAAIRGAFDGGADEVVVSDGHGGARNILIEELDGRARLNSGSPSPFSMVQGVDGGVQGVMLVGYHARMGTPNAILVIGAGGGRLAERRTGGRDRAELGAGRPLRRRSHHDLRRSERMRGGDGPARRGRNGHHQAGHRPHERGMSAAGSDPR
jgi:D-amino peptidase